MSFTTDLMKSDSNYRKKIFGLVDELSQKILQEKIKLNDINPIFLRNLVYEKIKEG